MRLRPLLTPLRAAIEAPSIHPRRLRAGASRDQGASAIVWFGLDGPGAHARGVAVAAAHGEAGTGVEDADHGLALAAGERVVVVGVAAHAALVRQDAAAVVQRGVRVVVQHPGRRAQQRQQNERGRGRGVKCAARATTTKVGESAVSNARRARQQKSGRERGVKCASRATTTTTRQRARCQMYVARDNKQAGESAVLNARRAHSAAPSVGRCLGTRGDALEQKRHRTQETGYIFL